jgi:hypothetical protein
VFPPFISGDKQVQPRFHGTKFAVPKSNLFDLFLHQRNLIDAQGYNVRSAVPLDIFKVFALKALETDRTLPVTRDVAAAISLLLKFSLDDLLSESSALQVSAAPEPITTLSERIYKRER